MKNDLAEQMQSSKVNKTTTTLILYNIVYYIITYYIVLDVYQDKAKAIEYLIIMPLYWLLAALILFVIFWFLKLKINSITEKILLFLASPIPIIIYLFL